MAKAGRSGMTTPNFGASDTAMYMQRWTAERRRGRIEKTVCLNNEAPPVSIQGRRFPRMYRLPMVLTLALAALPTSLAAQVAVTHDEAPESSVVEIQSPMKIEVGLGASPSAKGVMRPPMSEGPDILSRIFTDSAKYRVDKAQAKAVTIRRDYKKDKVVVMASVALATEYFRQDLNLTISLIDRGKEIKKEFWEDLTIGSEDNAASKMGALWASHSKTPRAEWKIPRATWDAMFADGESPTVRVVIEISE